MVTAPPPSTPSPSGARPSFSAGSAGDLVNYAAYRLRPLEVSPAALRGPILRGCGAAGRSAPLESLVRVHLSLRQSYAPHTPRSTMGLAHFLQIGLLLSFLFSVTVSFYIFRFFILFFRFSCFYFLFLFLFSFLDLY